LIIPNSWPRHHQGIGSLHIRREAVHKTRKFSSPR
jgi:hypothetical protein